MQSTRSTWARLLLRHPGLIAQKRLPLTLTASRTRHWSQRGVASRPPSYDGRRHALMSRPVAIDRTVVAHSFSTTTTNMVKSNEDVITDFNSALVSER